MAGIEQEFYPKGSIAMGNGDLVQVVNFDHTLNNGAKQISTLRKGQAGITLGPGDSQADFESVIPETGMERNYYRDCQKGTVRQIRFKEPGGRTLVMNGVFSSVKTSNPIDDAVKVSCTFIGKTDKQ